MRRIIWTKRKVAKVKPSREKNDEALLDRQNVESVAWEGESSLVDESSLSRVLWQFNWKIDSLLITRALKNDINPCGHGNYWFWSCRQIRNLIGQVWTPRCVIWELGHSLPNVPVSFSSCVTHLLFSEADFERDRKTGRKPSAENKLRNASSTDESESEVEV